MQEVGPCAPRKMSAPPPKVPHHTQKKFAVSSLKQLTVPMSTTTADTRPEASENGAAQKSHKSKKRKHADEVAQPDESPSKKKKKNTTLAEHTEPDGTKSARLALKGGERTDALTLTQSQSQDSSVQVPNGETAQPVKKRKKNKPAVNEEQEEEPPAPKLVKEKTYFKATSPSRIASHQSLSPHPQPENSVGKEKKKKKKDKDVPAGEHSGEAKRKRSKHVHPSQETASSPAPSKPPTSQPEHPQPTKKRKRQPTPDEEEEDEPAEPVRSAKKHKNKKRRTPSPTSPEPVAPPSPIVEVPATAEEASDSSTESSADAEVQPLQNGTGATSSASSAASDSFPPALEHSAADDLSEDGVEDQEDPEDAFTFDDEAPSPFHSTRLSIYVPIPARSLDPSTALSSLSAEHLAPTLLTYYPPAKGVVLAFSSCALSSERPSPTSASEKVVMATCGDQYGVSYIWLSATVLAFMPAREMELSGWMNVCSEGFVGLVSYNYFQVGVAQERIPKDWSWRPAGGVMTKSKKKGRKARMSKDGSVDTSQETSQETATAVERAEDDGAGYFVDASGTRVSGTLRYRVVDCEVVPGATRDTWTLQVEGTLLDAKDEAKVVEEEQQKEMRQRNKASGKAMMSGALAGSAKAR